MKRLLPIKENQTSLVNDIVLFHVWEDTDPGFVEIIALICTIWWLRWQSICLQRRRSGFDPWVGKISWRRKWPPTPVFLPGEFHGQRSLVGYNPWGCTESYTTEQLTQQQLPTQGQQPAFLHPKPPQDAQRLLACWLQHPLCTDKTANIFHPHCTLGNQSKIL